LAAHSLTPCFISICTTFKVCAEPGVDSPVTGKVVSGCENVFST
jgi:hypothetical protein